MEGMRWLGKPPFYGVPFATELDPWPRNWDETWKPVVIVDGRAHRLRELTSPLVGKVGYAVGLRPSDITRLVELADVVWLRLYEVRASDLSPLARMPQLRHLMVSWATKMTDYEWLRGLPSLQTLVLDDVRPADDLAPMGTLGELRALMLLNGMWSRMTARTLEPLANLPALEEASISIARIDEGGLRPLARCPALRRLDLHGVYPLEEYAYLRGRRPDLACERLVPWLPIALDGTTKNRQLIGKGKGFLDAAKDAARIRRHEEEFERLRAHFAAGGE